MTEHNEHQTFKADEIPSQEISDPAVLSKAPLVSVNIITYNHEPYIVQAIEGALMQKTNFPYEVLIGEDDSSDGTREICKEYAAKYPDKIRLFLNDRKNVIYINGQPTGRWNFINLLKKAKGKYIAICEGDDYWTDPYKLQKQVDFLEANPEYGLVHTELDHYYVRSSRYVKNHWKTSSVLNQSGDLYESLLGGQGSMIYACTSCFRNELIQDVDRTKLSRYACGDIPLWLHIAAKAKIGYINESTAVRNVLRFSATQGRDFDYNLKFAQSALLIFNDFNRIKPFSKETAYTTKQRYSQNICNICYQFRQRFELFQKNYSKLDNKHRTADLKLKRSLFKYSIPILISKVTLKMVRVMHAIRH
jgi:glycosyltransferase involved in cell wall biosynthesis